jgi:hypothetical protein
VEVEVELGLGVVGWFEVTYLHPPKEGRGVHPPARMVVVAAAAPTTVVTAAVAVAVAVEVAALQVHAATKHHHGRSTEQTSPFRREASGGVSLRSSVCSRKGVRKGLPLLRLQTPFLQR